MNLIKNIKTIAIICCSLTFFTCKAQLVSNTCNTDEDEALIIGIWVGEGLTIDNKWVFNNNHILLKYDEGALYETYTWQITCEITSSGLTDYSLEITNTSDSSDTYYYDLNTLTEERLVLVYQRGDGYGIAKPATYFRQ